MTDAQSILVEQAADVPWVAMIVTLVAAACVAPLIRDVLFEAHVWSARPRSRTLLAALGCAALAGVLTLAVDAHPLWLATSALVGGSTAHWTGPLLRRWLGRRLGE